ncbi:glycoside hydrolase family 3 C-terminal domain-containing protein [Microbacterium sp. A8/3-1]|uniref:Exo-alpha-(1->6)-L-arabinopyranosidase n=1 Tax=Microbacterium sp. A8/3-1 TaxID=3160749 RepID=A0AAU7VVF6_9MICO
MTSAETSDLTPAQQASLLTGGGFWETARAGDVAPIVLSDGPHGVRRQMQGTDHLGLHHSEPATCFPLAVAVGSSWSVEVAERVGTALARECRSLGVGVLLGPGVNIKRSPLGGRNFEYYSEDPVLTGVLAAAHVRGLQNGGVGASLKHFAANDQETDRMVISSDVDERTLREIYLAPFQHVVKNATPATVMCSYNKVNGVYASESRWLLNDVLRGDWGYEGVVVSDWGAVHDRVAALAAGLDLAMPGPGDRQTQAVLAAVEDGSIGLDQVDAAASRVTALSREYSNEPVEPFDVEQHHAIARELAADCAVLLKNDEGALPLSADSRLLVIGEFAESPRYQGGGSSHVNATQVDVPLEHIRAHASERNCEVRFERGFDTKRDDELQLRATAVAAAAEVDVDVAIVFAGNPDSEESEGYDRTRLELPSDQIALIREVAAAAPRTVVVLSNGGVVTLEGWHDEVDAVLEGFLRGQGGGAALADILFGVVNPSGHLAETIPLRLQDTPSYSTFPGEQGHVRYGEGVMVGYRHYETVDAAVRYPFGHGLSYTAFETRELVTVTTGPDTASVQVTVSNVGERRGKHVVQVYVGTEAGPVRRPVRTLGGFAKIDLDAGQTKVVSIDLDRSAFAYWDIERDGWVVASGVYEIQIGADASTVVARQHIDLRGDDLLPALSLQSSVGEWLSHPVAGPALGPLLSALLQQASDREDGSSAVAAQVAEAPVMPDVVRLMPMIQLVGVSGGAIDPNKLMALATQSVQTR